MQLRLVTVFALGLLLAVGWSALASAQQLDEASRATARTLGREGIEAYNNKNYPTATERLERAYRVVKAPSVALWSARALEKNGKLVEAAERYLEATRLPVTSGDRATQEQARTDAAKEREALAQRIPHLKIEIGSNVQEVHIDGVVVPLELLGVPRPVNPGSHTVTASRGDVQKSEPVVLKEGDNQVLRLELPADKAVAEKAGAGDSQAGKKGGAAKPGQDPGRTQRIIGWSSLAVGGVGVVVGSIAGVLVMTKHNSSEVNDSCVDGRCPSSVQGLDGYNAARTISPIGFIVGAVGLGAGAGLLLTAPKSSSQTASITPWVGVGSVGVSGGF
jgi:hypothetical protein